MNIIRDTFRLIRGIPPEPANADQFTPTDPSKPRYLPASAISKDQAELNEMTRAKVILPWRVDGETGELWFEVDHGATDWFRKYLSRGPSDAAEGSSDA